MILGEAQVPLCMFILALVGCQQTHNFIDLSVGSPDVILFITAILCKILVVLSLTCSLLNLEVNILDCHCLLLGYMHWSLCWGFIWRIPFSFTSPSISFSKNRKETFFRVILENSIRILSFLKFWFLKTFNFYLQLLFLGEQFLCNSRWRN